MLALPAIIAGAPVSHSLATAAYLGIGLLAVLLAAGAAAFLTDAPLKVAGGVIQWLLERHDSASPARDTAAAGAARGPRLHPYDAWRALEGSSRGGSAEHRVQTPRVALCATGGRGRPTAVARLLAYTTGELLALIPFTPGGLGFVEAGLVGTLTLAGVPGHDALVATLLYRLAAYWLPIPAGGLAYLLFRRRYHPSPPNTTDAPDSSD